MKNFYFLLIFLCVQLHLESSDELFSVSFAEEVSPQNGGDNSAGIKELGEESSDFRTIQVRKPEEFPRILQSGQRVALFLDDSLIPQGGTHLVLECLLIHQSKPNGSKSPSVEMRFNQKTIFKRLFYGNNLPVSSVIPSSCIEEHGNVLEIRNSGIRPFAFKSLKLKTFDKSEYEPCELAETEKKHERLADVAKTCFGDMRRRKSMCGFVQLHLLYKFNDGCGNADYTNMLTGKYFFDPVSGEPLDTYFAVLRLKQLYEGNPVALPSNLVLKNRDGFIDCYSTSWQAVLNSDGVVTVHVSALYEDKGQEADLILPIPWTGKTKLTTTKGFIPEKLAGSYPDEDKLGVETKEVDIFGGIYETGIILDRAVTFRFVRDGTKDDTEKTVLCPIIPKRNKAAFAKGLVSVSNKRSDTGAVVRTGLREKGMTSETLGANCSLKTSDATKGEVDGIKNIVPREKWSDFVEISYPDGKSYPCEGANLCFSGVPQKYDEFSFWVYPQSERKAKKLTLQFYLENSYGYHFLAVDLKPEKWQRVSLPSDKVKLPSYGKICIIGDPKLPEYKDGAKVSFEFNGFCVIGNEHPKFGASGLKTARIAGGVRPEKEKTFVFIGKPDSYFEYRHQFKEPVEFSTITELSDYKGLKYVYRKEAQILEIGGRFPKTKNGDKTPEELHDESLEALDDNSEEDGDTTEAVRALSESAKKLCVPAELAEYNKGNSILVVCIVIK